MNPYLEILKEAGLILQQIFLKEAGLILQQIWKRTIKNGIYLLKLSILSI